MEEIELKQFQKNIKVRQLKLKDYESVKELQLKCFPGMHPWAEDQFKNQVKTFPKGQLCVEFDGKVIASSSS